MARTNQRFTEALIDAGKGLPKLCLALSNAMSSYLRCSQEQEAIARRADPSDQLRRWTPRKPATKFTHFTELPLEIRLIIWKLAMPDPRVVELRMRTLKKTISDWNAEVNSGIGNLRDRCFAVTKAIVQQYWHLDSLPLPGFCSPCLPPSLLLVCREAHQVASEFYTKTFASAAGIAETYFDAKRDILFLRCNAFYVCDSLDSPDIDPCDFVDMTRNLLMLRDQDFLASIENLAVLCYDPEELPSPEQTQSFANAIEKLLQRSFTGLKKLTLVGGHYCREGDGEQLSLMPPCDVLETIKQDLFYNIQLSNIEELPVLPEPVEIEVWDIALELDEMQDRSNITFPAIEWKVVVPTELDVESRDTERRVLEEIEDLSPRFW